MSEPRNAMISVRLTAPLKAELERAAEADGRSVSALVERILLQWAAVQGRAPRPVAKRSARSGR